MKARHQPSSSGENPLLRYLPHLVVGLATLYLVASLAAMPRDPEEGMRLQSFGVIPIVDNGRVKPIDTLARTSLMLITRRQYFVDAEGRSQPAIRWLLDVMGGKGDEHKVFYIENEEVQEMLGLERRKGFRYAYSEFQAKEGVLQKEIERIQNQKGQQLEVYDDKIMELARRVRLFRNLRETFDLSLYNEVRKDQEKLKSYLAYLHKDSSRQPHLVALPDGEWQPFTMAAIMADLTGQHHDEVLPLLKLEAAYVRGDSARFNQELESYLTKLNQERPDDVRTAGLETFLSAFAPFAHCYLLYVIVTLLVLCSWIALSVAGRPWMDALNRAAFWLAVLTLAVHTFGMVSRMVIQGRPPVTNLYSSAVYIGWCAVIVGLVIERIFRIGIGNLIAGAIGFGTTVIAYHLAEIQPSSSTGLRGGDTMEMLQAVLDTNFWLWTHVTCITFGYSAMFMAGKVASIFIILGLFTPLLTREWLKVFGQVMYGIVCFATFLSFTGTVLGGIWADQSWGRFWGWDPKENGALLLVIWSALILHARWCGWIKVRGMAVLCVFGNIITAWSWFGTNQLPVGLHSYGRNELLAEGLKWYWLSQLLLIGIGLIPTSKWRSFGRDVPATAGKQPSKPKDDGGRGSDLDERAKDEPLA